MLMRNRVFAGAALSVVVFLQGADAHAAGGYVNNAEQWERLSAPEKAAYAEGLNDFANYGFLNDDLATAVLKVARTQCLMQTKMAPNILSDVITTAYQKQPQLRSAPPVFVYVQRLADICRPFINDRRSEFGLPPQ